MVMSMEQRSDSRVVRDLQTARTAFFFGEHGPNGIAFGIVPPDRKGGTQPDTALQLIGEALLQAKCDINAVDSNGRTPLMYAARYNQPTAVRLLLEHGANVKALDKSGMTALDLAKQFNSKEVIGLLQQF
jgi:hypothetical protein